MEKRVLRTVGRCIYCRTTDGKLTEEHIIPYGLSGVLSLKAASCEDCQKRTSALERKIQRGVLLETRTKLRTKTRNRKERPTAFQRIILDSESTEVRAVPVGETAAILLLPLYDLPGFLRGVPDEGTIRMPGVFAKPLTRTTDALRDPEQTFLAHFSPPEFARFLAKIALGAAVAELGLEGIQEDFVSPSIRDMTHDVGQWVGCMSHRERQRAGVLHEMNVGITKEGLILVRVHLFASRGAPEYWVVVGRASDNVPEEKLHGLRVIVSVKEGTIEGGGILSDYRKPLDEAPGP